MFFRFCDNVCSNFLHPLWFFSLFAYLLSISSVCLDRRAGGQSGYGRLHLPGTAAHPSLGHSRGRRRFLVCSFAVEELPGPSAPSDVFSAPASSPLTSALPSALTPIHQKLFGTGETFWSQCIVQQPIKRCVNNKQCHKSQQESCVFFKITGCFHQPI